MFSYSSRSSGSANFAQSSRAVLAVFTLFLSWKRTLGPGSLTSAVTSLWSDRVSVPAHDRASVQRPRIERGMSTKSIWLYTWPPVVYMVQVVRCRALVRKYVFAAWSSVAVQKSVSSSPLRSL